MFELGTPARQLLGTSQGWWLSFLELARRSGKLRAIFGPTGKFGGSRIPPRKGQTIYGPAWQRVIMAFLGESARWRHVPASIVPTSARKTELSRLAGLIGIDAAFGAEINVVPSSIHRRVAALPAGQMLVLDIKTPRSGHTISGVATRKHGAGGMIRAIDAYCQQTEKSYSFTLSGPGHATLSDGDAVVNWMLPVG